MRARFFRTEKQSVACVVRVAECGGVGGVCGGGGEEDSDGRRRGGKFDARCRGWLGVETIEATVGPWVVLMLLWRTVVTIIVQNEKSLTLTQANRYS